ncbi:hypothetical protein Rhal01_00876 [Rubritalea halochordaticola]|uniref:Peptidase A2 domain-containing protein n=1 Tax=Rubritalea halochordaticola TaxID=714537 RepID=A0ABP9UWF3_9BACT
MKRITKLVRLGLATIALSSPVLADDDINYRQFTSSDGKTISAVVVDKDDESVTLLLENGKRAKVPNDRLGADDQEYVKGWNKAKAIFLQQCRGLTIGELLTLRGYEGIPIKFMGNSMLIKAELNGKPAKFILDTGAGTSLIHTGTCERTGCALGPFDQKVYGVSGEAPAAWSDVDEIKIGESVFKNRKILATDMLRDKPKGSPLRDDGLFGADFLSQLDAVISYRERKVFIRPDKSDESTLNGESDEEALTFRIFKTKRNQAYRGNIVKKTASVVTIKLHQQDKEVQVPISQLSEDDALYAINWSEAKAMFLRHCRSLTIRELLELREYQDFEYDRKGNHIFVDGKLNQKDVTWMIDTGADNSLLHIDAAKEAGVEVGPMDKKVYGVGGEAPAAACSVESVELGKAIFRKRKVLATDLDRFDQNISYVGLFGADFMRECNAVITYSEKRIFLKQN